MLEYDISDSWAVSVEARYSKEDENTCGSDGNGTVDPNGSDLLDLDKAELIHQCGLIRFVVITMKI